MRDALRFVVWLPLSVLEFVWERLTRDEMDDFIAEQHQRFLDMSEGE